MLRVAVVGAGGMAQVHAGNYSRIEGAELVGVMDIQEAAANALGERFGAAAYTDFDLMLLELKPDIVDVCCPTPWHAEYACRTAARAAELGIRGICTEKPMARTLEECDRMTKACEEAGVLLFVAHVVRFFPEYVQAKKQIDAGAVGAPAAARTRRGGGDMPQAWNDWYGKFEMSGGVTLDTLVHDFDWLRWTFGEVERVYAKGTGKAHMPGLDYALVTLRFKSGVIAHVEGTWADPSAFKTSFEIAGDKGLLECSFNQPNPVPFTKSLSFANAAKTGFAVPESPSNVNPYQAELAHFLSCVESGTPLCITPEDGKEAVRIALAAIESMQTGKPVAINN